MGCPRALRISTIAECLTPEFAENFWTSVKVGALDECWCWRHTKNADGYGVCSHVLAHRIALVLSGRVLLQSDCVLHSCDNPPCCNPHHLRVGTRLENTDDCRKRGRMRYGFPASAYRCECGGTKAAKANRCLVCEGVMPLEWKYPSKGRRKILDRKPAVGERELAFS